MIQQFELQNFRLFRSAKFECRSGINLISGANATGKTSLLEALWFASSGKSFRTTRLAELIYNAQFSDYSDSSHPVDDGTKRRESLDSCKVLIDIDDQKLGIYRTAHKNIYLLGHGQQLSAVDHARLLPILLITPESIALIASSPQKRRQSLIWGCFYAFNWFQSMHANYKRILKQRNAAIKQNHLQQLPHWNQLMAESVAKIACAYAEYLQHLEPIFQSFVKELLPKINTQYLRLNFYDSISRQPQWRDANNWLNQLESCRAHDIRQQTTTIGIHRCDVMFSYQGRSLFQQLSRGQWKTMGSAYQLAQGSLMQQHTQNCPTVLMDDFSSELDVDHRSRFIHSMLKSGFKQSFISTVDKQMLAGLQNHTIELI